MKADKSLLIRFVKENLVIITSTENNVFNLVKRAKAEYFVQKSKKKHGIPKNKEIAMEAINLLIKAEKITPNNPENILEQCPFLRKYITKADLEMLFEDLEPPETILTTEDIRKLEQKEFIERKEKELFKSAKEKIEMERLAALNRAMEEVQKKFKKEFKEMESERIKMEKEKTEIEKLKSEIEDYDIEELEKCYPILESDTIKDSLGDDNEWWRKIGIFKDPFPTTDGLSLIEEEYYDSIILLTPIFQKYQNQIKTNIDRILNKTYIIIGEFGSGKTTLFDYLSKLLFSNGVFPIHLILDAEPNANKIRRQFFKSMVSELTHKYMESYNIDPRTIYSDFGRIETHEILNNILEKCHYKGFVIFIDGLHKNGFYFPQVKAFIQNLQNTRDFFIRKKLPLSIFIAGSKRWELDLMFSPSVAGSIHLIEKIDEISANDAYQMVNNRLAAFSIEQTKQTKVDRKSIDNIHINLKHKLNRDVTFRDIIEEISPRLEATDFGVVRVAMKFDRPLLEEIREELGKNSEFISKIENMDAIIGGRLDIFEKLIDTISKIYDYRGINESDDFFISRKSDFAILYKAGLVQKTQDKNRIKWIPDKVFMDVAYTLKSKFKVDLSDLLIDLFSYDKGEEKKVHDGADNTHGLRKLANSYEETLPSFSKSLRKAADIHTKIIEHLESPVDLIEPNKMIDFTNKNLFYMIDSLFWISEKRGLEQFKLLYIREKISWSWYDLPDVMEHWNHIDFLESKGIILDSKESTEVAVNYKRAFLSLVNIIRLCAACNSIVELSSNSLTINDKKSLNSVREMFYRMEMKKSARILTDLVEEKMRNFIYLILLLKFGDKWKRRLSKTVNEYIFKQKSRSKTKINPKIDSQNDLYYCTRSHYEHIITEVKGNWEIIFERCFEPESKEWVKETLGLISEIGNKDKHNSPESFFKKNSDKLLECIHRSKRLIELIDVAYIKVVAPEHIIIEDEDEDKDDNKIFFSFKSGIDILNLQPLVIIKDEGNKIGRELERRVREEGKVVIDLSDVNSIEYEFSTGYRLFLGVLGFAVKSRKLLMKSIEGSIVELSISN